MWELRRFTSQGIPDGARIRSTMWKLLLGYLPPERGQWSSELAKKRSQYRYFKEELLMNPSEITRRLEKSVDCDNDESNSECKGLLSRSHITLLSQLPKEHDEELWRHLEITTKVNPQFYAFRWITLLLTQEFNFVDILYIWDTLFSDPEGPLVLDRGEKIELLVDKTENLQFQLIASRGKSGNCDEGCGCRICK
ncbi:Tetratricopeptide repeat-like superfamily protein isoform 1 [Hibiscus syriacus]|uniref:Tetratricopeptide repeat-like superfamily protein isoform 1 n=1 Tax=Hibiscus syriacus TaxID=106335 RepID=A0A6A2YEN8_HIBSY|nr:Tetratricopeptide repeat-like superfamily protein isoform 1 [Hibiscus syriacus]